MDQDEPLTVQQRLNNLRIRLDQVIRVWTVEDYTALLKLYIDILPKLMDAERCTIFVSELGTDKIWSMLGTGLDDITIEPPSDDKSIVGRAISTGKCIIEYNLDKQIGFHKEMDSLTNFVTRSLICAPIKNGTGQGIAGAIEVLNKKGGKKFTEEDEHLLMEIAHFLTVFVETILINQKILQISKQINSEVEKFDLSFFRDIPFIAESKSMREILDRVKMIRKLPVNVLIQGESGTGKELIARMIHEGSERNDKPFVAVNCSAIPENLMESQFFGFEKGAFTGANYSRKGFFEEADGGTLMLDEIAEMDIRLQPKFLRALQEGEGSRLGSNILRHYDLRIISCTNKDLRKEKEEGRFRDDLFYRLFSVDIYVPPLRTRKEDIIIMAHSFLDRICKNFRKHMAGFSPEVLNLLERYHWPGNVRQLITEIENLVAFTPEGEMITIKNCSYELQKFYNQLHDKKISNNFFLPAQVKELEIGLIKKALHDTGGNKIKAAAQLGITRQGLHKKLKRYNIGSEEKEKSEKITEG